MTLIEIRARVPMTSPQHVYEVRPRSDQRGFDLISYVLPFGRLWYAERNAVERRRFAVDLIRISTILSYLRWDAYGTLGL